MSTRLFPPSSLIGRPTPIECDAGVTMWRWIESASSLSGQTLILCALVIIVSRSTPSPTGVSHVVALEEPTTTVTTQGLSTIFSCNFFCYVVLYWGLQLIYNVLCRPTTGNLGNKVWICLWGDNQTQRPCWSAVVCSAYTPVYDAGPTLNQHWFTVLCMQLGHLHSAM